MVFLALAVWLSWIESASGTEDHMFVSRQDVRFIGLYIAIT
jgi:hypothetical protein